MSMHAASKCVDMTIADHDILGKAEVETLMMTVDVEKTRQTSTFDRC